MENKSSILERNFKKKLQDDQRAVGQRIRLLRKREGLSQQEMANILEIGTQTLSHVERGERKPSSWLLHAIYEKYDIPPLWIMIGSEDGRPFEELIAPPVSRGDFATGEMPEAIAEVAVHYGPAETGDLPLFNIEGGDAPVRYADEAPGRASYRHTLRPVGVDDPHAFTCELHGDSMEPGFHAGDILGFCPGAPLHSGDYACVRLEDDTSTFRRVFFLEGEVVRLLPLNSVFPELRMARDKIKGMFRLVWRISRY